MMTPSMLCSAELTHTFVDLGMSPPCESYLGADELDSAEKFYPLHVRTCAECLLVQLPAYIDADEIFSHYAYFSSYSDSWVAHAKSYVDEAVVTGEPMPVRKAIGDSVVSGTMNTSGSFTFRATNSHPRHSQSLARLISR